jgi:hypothetical protein
MNVPPDVSACQSWPPGEIANSAFAPRKIITRAAAKLIARLREINVATLALSQLRRAIGPAKNPSWYLTVVSANFYLWPK